MVRGSTSGTRRPKTCGRPRLKGQLVFEFVVATMLFIVIVFFVMLTLNNTISSFTGGYYRNHISEEAMRVSEQLVNSPGIWVSGEPRLLGLAAEWPEMNDTEIKYLKTFCGSAQNRTKLPSLLGLESRGDAQGVRLVLSNASEAIIDCSTGASYLEQAYAERFAYAKESGLIKLGVYVW